MATDTPPDRPPLEHLLVAALRSDGDLGAGLRLKINDLIHWLVDQPVGDSRWPLVKALFEVQECAAAPAVTGSESKPAASPDATDLGDDPTPGADLTAADVEQSPDPEQVAAAGLAQLWHELHEDSHAGRYCLAYDPPPGEGTGLLTWLWTRLHLVFLRLEAESARGYRERAATAAGDYRGQLPSPLPGIQPDGSPGQVELHELAGRLEGRWPKLPGLIITMNWLAHHDAGVKAAHYAITDHVEPFSEHSRQMFTNNLRDTLRKLTEVRAGTVDEVELLVDLDSMLRGVLPVPLPMEGSWWTSSLDESKVLLFSHQQCQWVGAGDLNMENASAFKKYFEEGIAIPAADTADGNGKSGSRVWLLRYPAAASEGPKGRYISVQ
jgi:hypothetical protein